MALKEDADATATTMSTWPLRVRTPRLREQRAPAAAPIWLYRCGRLALRVDSFGPGLSTLARAACTCDGAPNRYRKPSSAPAKI